MIKKIFFVLFWVFVFCPSLVQAQDKQEIYLVPVNFDSGKLSLGEITTKSGYVPPQDDFKRASSVYWIRLVSFNGELLLEKRFPISLIVSYAPPKEGESYEGSSGDVQVDKVNSMAILPYFANAKWLELYDANRRLVEKKDIAYLADVCGDGVCQDHESAESCSKDCPANGADDYCDIKNPGNDPDCRKLKLDNTTAISTSSGTVVETKSNSLLKYIILGSLLVVLLGIAYGAYRYFSDKKSQGSEL